MNRPRLLAFALCTSVIPGQDPAPKTARLVYDLPGAAVAARDQPGREALMTRVAGVIDKRLAGMVTMARGEGTTFEIRFDRASEAKVAFVRRHIELAGKFEIRLIAVPEYDAAGVRFELAGERSRLQSWLDGGGLDRISKDPFALLQFHQLEAGGPLDHTNLRWLVRPQSSSPSLPGRWSPPEHDLDGLRASTIMTYTAADWNEGRIPPAWLEKPLPQRRLRELVAINRHAGGFDNRDLKTSRIQVTSSTTDAVAVYYEFKPDRGQAYGDWSEQHQGAYAAVLLDDEVVATPRFGERAQPSGLIAYLGNERSHAVVAAMRRPLPYRPRLVELEVR